MYIYMYRLALIKSIELTSHNSLGYGQKEKHLRDTRVSGMCVLTAQGLETGAFPRGLTRQKNSSTSCCRSAIVGLIPHMFRTMPGASTTIPLIHVTFYAHK